MAERYIQIQGAPLSFDEVMAFFEFPMKMDDPPMPETEGGALVTFCGNVRAKEGEGQVTHLSYEHYTGMAEREMEKLADRAEAHWPLQKIALIHQSGEVPVGKPSVIVAVLAAHREEAFAAARFLIDELKKSVPIWKSS